jgi:hypothetical protein
VASVDASISGVAVELQQCSLRRSTAAAPLLPRLLAASTADGAAMAGGSLGSLEQQAAAVMAAGSSDWVEVLALEPEPPTPASHPGKQQQREEAKLAVSFQYFNTTGAPGDAASSRGGGKAAADGQLRCAVALGRLLLAHSPGFATNLLLFAGQNGAATAPASSAVVAKNSSSSSNGSDEPAGGGSASTSRTASPVKPVATTSPGAAAQQEAGSPSLLEQALQPQLLLECRVAQVQLAALASQAPGAAAAALLLQQLELRSGALNWGQPWNSHLRNALLAPAQGELVAGSVIEKCHGWRPALTFCKIASMNFPCTRCHAAAGFAGHGLRLSLGAATLAIADSAAADAAAAAGDCSGLWQLRHAGVVSNTVQLDGVLAEAPPPDGAAVSSAQRLLLSAALSPLRLQLSGQQAGALAAVAGGVQAEAQQGFKTPLVEQIDQQQQQPGAPSPDPWLASFSVSSTGGMQLAYAATGGLQLWQGSNGSSISANSSSGDTGGEAELYLGLGTLTASLAASPAAEGQPCQLLLQAQLVQPHAWLLPSLAMLLPAAELRLGSGAPGAESLPLLPEPLLLLAGLSYERRKQQGAQLEQRSSAHLRSLALAVQGADYPLLIGLLRCLRQQPMLPARPALLPASEGQQLAEHQQQQQQQQQAVVAADSAAATGAEGGRETELLVSVDAASISLWPQKLQQEQGRQQQQQQQQQQGQGERDIGVALWLGKLRLRKQHWEASDGGGSSGARVTLVTARAALMRQPQQPQQQQQQPACGSRADAPQFSSVLRFPDAPSAQQQPALTLCLTNSWASSSNSGSRAGNGSLSPSKSPGRGGRTLQLQAAPISLTVSRELSAAVGAISSDWGSTGLPQQQQQPQQGRKPLPASTVAAEKAPEPLHGKAAVQGVRLLLLGAAAWDQQQRWQQEQQQQQRQPQTSAVEVAIEEAVVLLQQVPAAENRPWLASSSQAAAALLTSADASLIGAAITVRHAGECLRVYAGAGRGRGRRIYQWRLDAACLCYSIADRRYVACLLHVLQGPRVPTPPLCCRPPMAACSCCCSRTRAR